MDFGSLPRRELQILCKKNNIPANVTNVSMAASLNSLEIVEGIDEVFQTCESEMAQLSIEPRARLEVASPFLPPTGGRSTRRKNAATEEASRRSTRTTMAEYANESQVDAFETPVALQTNRKKGQTASACIKMDAVLTPAPWGVTSQRRRAAKEDSAVKEVQGTRRSVRLAEKSAKMLKGQNSDFSKKDLFTEDSKELNPDVLDEISGVTDVSASTNMEECSAKKDEEQVDSAEKQNIATDVEIAVDAVTVVEENHEENIQPEVVPCEKQVVSTAKKDEEQTHSAEEQDIATGAETVVDAVTIVVENPENNIQPECEKQVVSTVVLGGESTDEDPGYEYAEAVVTPLFVENEAVHQLPIKLESSLIIPPASTQIRASASKETSMKKRIIAAASDNKENINSGSKTTRLKERSEVVKEINETFQKLDDQTIWRLSNEVKKLEITQKLDKNEGGNEVSARPALQVLQKNQ